MCPDKIVPVYVNIYLFMWMTSFLNNSGKLVLFISLELLLIGES